MERRLFLLAGTAAAIPLYAGPLVTFSEQEAKLVEALTDAIIPADDAPGAVAAGVVFYIDRQLAGPLQRMRGAYTQGLPQLDAACRQMKNAGFLDLPPGARHDFLQSQEGVAFFNMVVDHTMQGFYGSPEHGGNRGEASWKMLGIEDVMRGGHARHADRQPGQNE